MIILFPREFLNSTLKPLALNSLTLLLFCISFQGYAQQLAFPTAEGFGKYASGGRGGVVIKVTNLNDSGPGSLRQALQYTTGPRTVVFEVGGTITLNSNLIIKGNCTVAGQTAPGDGILIRGSQVSIQESNVIIRYIRFRPGLNVPDTQVDGLSVIAWNNDVVENVVIDHCSISWALDENLSMRAPNTGVVRNITVQNSIISEALYGSLAGERIFNKTYYKNLFAHTSERNIVSYYPTSDKFDYEMINNLIYGVGGATGAAMGSKYTILNNHYKNSSEQSMYPIIIDHLGSAQNTGGNGTYSETYSYISGNIIPSGTTLYSANVEPYLKTSPYLSSEIIPIDANQVAEDILPHVGASLPKRDAVDIRLIDQYNSDTGEIQTSGEYPTLLNGVAPIDSDDDGMPNLWELENGLNPNNSSDRNTVQPDGYTNLEYFLNGMTLTSIIEVDANAGNDVIMCKGDSVILTASGGSIYAWSTGESTPSIEVYPSQTTTYSVTVYNASGTNSDTDSVTVTVNETPNVFAGLDQTITIGESVTLTGTGADSYSWNTGQTTSSITVSPNTTTTYTVTGSANGCDNIDSVTIFVDTDSESVNAEISGGDIALCNGESTELVATGGATYIWNTGETTSSISVTPTETTTYSVTAFSASGNSQDTDTVTVSVNNLPSINAGNNVTIAQGASVTLSVTGAESYMWNTGQSTSSILVNPDSTTVYSVTGFSNGCEATDQVTVFVQNDNSNETVDADIGGGDFSICAGTMTTLVASGGSSYLWSTGETTSSIAISPTETTTYTLIAYSESGNTQDQDSITVSVYGNVNLGDDIEICSGGTVTLTSSTGESYLWSTGETTQSITVNPIETTTYTVQLSEKFCTSSDDITVIVSDTLSIDAGNDVTIFPGESTTLTASGGAESYLWNTGETTASIIVNPNTTTTYSVTGYSNGCEATDEVTVTVQNETVIANAGDDVTICNGETTTLTATGGTSYLWNTGQTSASIIVTPDITTTYSVTVYGSIPSNSDQDNVTVTVNPLPSVNAGNNVTIFQGETTTLTATGAQSYSWSTGETSASISVNPNSTTTYSVTGYANGCEATDQVTVSVQNETVIANAGLDVEICQGESTTLTASGGATYLWNTGQTSASITVAPGSTTTYTVTAYGSLPSNSDQDSVTVTVNPLPSVNAGTNVTIFEGESTTLTASGAQSYLWSTGETSASISVNPNSTTTYSVTGYSNGCEATDQVIVFVDTDTGNETVVADIGGGDFSICAGTTTTLIAYGGYSYVWSTGETTSSIVINPMETTLYILTAFNESGNLQDQDSILVSVYGNADAGDDVAICRGSSTTLTASAGQSYLWSTGETTQSISVSPLATTVYSVEVVEKFCTSSDEVTVIVNDVLSVNAGNNVTILQGDSATLVATGADSYLWNTGETSASISVNPNSTTTYSVTGFSNGCEGTDYVTVIVEEEEEEEEEIVNADIGGGNFSICSGTTTTLVANGGASYLWSNGATTNSITVTPSVTTTYTVTAFSASGNSQDQDSVTITVNNVQVDAGNDVTIVQGESTILTATGASSYLWSTGEITQSISVSPTSTQTYSVSGFFKRCEDTDQITVNVTSSNISNIRIINQEMCQGDDTILTASEGDQYVWNTGETSRNITISPNVNSEYSVTIYDGLVSNEEIIRVSVLDCEDDAISSLDSDISDSVDFIIIQNPSSSLLKAKIIGLDQAIPKRIAITNMNGKNMYYESLGTSETDRSIDVSSYHTGIYAIRLTYQDKSIIKKIVIK